MRTILIPVDGSRESDAAVKAVVAQGRREPIDAIHLLNVQRPMGHYVKRFIDRATIREFQREEAERALADSRRILDNAGFSYQVHFRTGRMARTIARTADELRAGEVVMGADCGGLLANLRLWLLVTAVQRHASVPVVVVMSPDRRAAPGLPLTESRPSVTH